MPSEAHLIRIPTEVRLEVYKHLFSSISFAWMEEYLPAPDIALTQTPNALSLLRACRQIHLEARSIWLEYAEFEFENLEQLMNTLSALPDTILSQVRHVFLASTSILFLPSSDRRFGRTYTLVWALKLLAGLALEIFTVIGMSSGEEAYETLDDLIRYGNGWKELRFITAKSSMLGYQNVQAWPTRKPQPVTWKNVMDQKDGNLAGASVEIYRSTIEGDGTRTVMNPATRQSFEQSVSDNSETLGVETGTNLMAKGEIDKGMMVVVKRGKDVSVVENDTQPYIYEDIRSVKSGITWSLMRDVCVQYF